MGSVGVAGPSVKKAITNSSSDRVNASSAARDDGRADARDGDPEERRQLARAQVAGRLLQVRVHVAQARPHDRRHERGAEHDVRQQHRVQAERQAHAWCRSPAGRWP